MEMFPVVCCVERVSLKVQTKKFFDIFEDQKKNENKKPYCSGA